MGRGLGANLASNLACRASSYRVALVSLSDAEAREDLAEQVVARELAGELAQAHLRVAQLLGRELGARSSS